MFCVSPVISPLTILILSVMIENGIFSFIKKLRAQMENSKEKLYQELALLLLKEEQLLKQTEDLLNKAKATIDPRQEFNKWLRSSEGKIWKQKQYKYQGGKCAYCKEDLRFADAVVHHVNSLQEFGHDANKPENFKLLHQSCNLKIGTKIVSFD